MAQPGSRVLSWARKSWMRLRIACVCVCVGVDVIINNEAAQTHTRTHRHSDTYTHTRTRSYPDLLSPPAVRVALSLLGGHAPLGNVFMVHHPRHTHAAVPYLGVGALAVCVEPVGMLLAHYPGAFEDAACRVVGVMCTRIHMNV
jgi:hypothetical protein